MEATDAANGANVNLAALVLGGRLQVDRAVADTLLGRPLPDGGVVRAKGTDAWPIPRIVRSGAACKAS
jgi:hypothetical protein